MTEKNETEKTDVTKAGIPFPTPNPNDSEEFQREILKESARIYRYVIYVLGFVVILVIVVTAIIILQGQFLAANALAANATEKATLAPPEIPDGLIAIGSAAVGAIAGLLAQSPATAPASSNKPPVSSNEPKPK